MRKKYIVIMGLALLAGVVSTKAIASCFRNFTYADCPSSSPNNIPFCGPAGQQTQWTAGTVAPARYVSLYEPDPENKGNKLTVKKCFMQQVWDREGFDSIVCNGAGDGAPTYHFPNGKCTAG